MRDPRVLYDIAIRQCAVLCVCNILNETTYHIW